MTLILTNTTVLGRIQYRQTNTKSNQQSIYQRKNWINNLFGFCLLSFDNGFPGCRFPLLSLLILWDPSLPSWIPIIVQLYGCPCSATHASGTANRAQASCLQSRAIERPTTRLCSWGEWKKKKKKQIGLCSGGWYCGEWRVGGGRGMNRKVRKIKKERQTEQTEQVQTRQEYSYLGPRKKPQAPLWK